MNKNLVKILIAVLAVIILLRSTFYIVDQRQQVLVLQFGEPVKLVETPGLKMKMPLLQNVIVFDKRILDLAITDQEVIASDQKRLIINAFTKYKITDPLKFYTTARSEAGLRNKLGTILDSSLRQIVGEVPLIDLLSENRGVIMKKIQDAVSEQSKIFGIEIVDVRIMRGDLPKENSNAIFARMQTEREKEAKEIRAKGAEEGKKIKAEADKQRTIILANARKQSEIIRGEGDSKANKVYAGAFSRDPEFADFYRSMNAYKESLGKGDTKMILSPNNEFFKYLNR